ncbi:hypothetical protein [Cellulomonas endometrii]|uniref:hypothetical protein n=1 Tax=Cellulomonas endometrii TaxID=3036301 RepID=UPI0024AE6852|nr:hypothetical protein [Cellulomonas endometrii]
MTGVDLLWIPLGAGGSPIVRLSGRLYEGLAARRGRRPPCGLVHAALEVRPGGPAVTVEVTPVWGQPAGPRGVVTTGPVGAPVLGRSRFFRYEVRCWAGGTIPDAAWAVERSVVANDAPTALRLLDAAPGLPRHTWGRDPGAAGDMWTSNSVVAWLLARAGVDTARCGPPAGCRAPGWDAGVAAAHRGP